MWKGMIVYANQQCTWWIYCPGHAGMWISERVNRLVLRMPAVGTLKIDKRDIMQTFNECMLVEVTITDGTEGSRMLEFEIKYGSNRNRRIVQSSQLWLSYRNRHMRGQIWLASTSGKLEWATSTPYNICGREQNIYGFAWKIKIGWFLITSIYCFERRYMKVTMWSHNLTCWWVALGFILFFVCVKVVNLLI